VPLQKPVSQKSAGKQRAPATSAREKKALPPKPHTKQSNGGAGGSASGQTRRSAEGGSAPKLSPVGAGSAQKKKGEVVDLCSSDDVAPLFNQHKPSDSATTDEDEPEPAEPQATQGRPAKNKHGDDDGEQFIKVP